MDQIILLQAAPGGMSNLLGYLFPVLMIGVMYFFMIRPQQQQQQKLKALQESLHPGMDIVTSSGLIGKITKVEDSILTVQIDAQKDVRVRISRLAVQGEFKAKAEA